MPYEFLAKNGLISQGNITATGSLTVTQNITASNISASGTIIATSFTGSFSGSIGTAINATSASYALSASYAPTNTNITASWATNSLTASYLTPSNIYTVAGLSSGYVEVTGIATIPNTGIYRPAGKTLGLSADGTLILKIDGNASPYVTSIETGNFIVPSGSVGIGVVSPVNKLDINGNISASVITASFFGTSSWATNAVTASFVSNAFVQGGNSFGTTALLGTNDANSLAFETNGSTRMTINSGGQVGIGVSPVSFIKTYIADTHQGSLGSSSLYIETVQNQNQGLATSANDSGINNVYTVNNFTSSTVLQNQASFNQMIIAGSGSFSGSYRAERNGILFTNTASLDSSGNIVNTYLTNQISANIPTFSIPNWIAGTQTYVALSTGNSTGSITNLYNHQIGSPFGSGGSGGITVTNSYGIYINKQKTTNIVTNGWGIYQIDTGDLNIFAGKTRIGSTTVPVNTLDVTGNISASVVTASLFFGTASFATTAQTASSLVAANSYTVTNLTASNVLRAAKIAEKVVTFTPLTGSLTGAPAWYRIISGSGVLDSGRVRMSANYDNSRSDIEFTYAVRNYDTDGAGAFINITRASTYNSVFNAVRVIEGTLNDPYAIDVLIGNYLNNTTPDTVTCLYESQFIGAVLDTPTFVSASATGSNSNVVKTVYTTYTSGYPRIGPVYSDGLSVATYQGQLTVGYRGNYNYGSPSTNNYALLVSGSVGIGTTSPGEKLTVSGSSYIIGGTGAVGTGTAYYLGDSSNKDISLTRVGAASLAIGRYFPSAWVETIRFTADGNVGIGTTVPADKLHVIGNIRINGGDILNWGGQAFIQTIGANDMFFRPNSTLRMILTAAGNLGLGNGFTSPAYLLDVSGSSRHGYQASDTHQFTGSVSISGSLNATASWANNVVSASYALTSSFATRAQTANALNALNTYSIAGLTSAYVDVDGSSAPTTGIYRPSTKTLGLSADSTLIFKISNVSTTATSSIETGNFLVSGSVGIGTTTPAAKLEVASGEVRIVSSAAFTTHLNYLNTGMNYISCANNQSTIFRDSGTVGTMMIIVGGTGNVGIGTASPTARLHVSGSTGGVFEVDTAGGATTFYVSASGNVGIGTTNPVAKLHVIGNISGSSFTSSVSNAVGFLGTSSWAQNVVSASFATTAQTANALNASNTYTIAGLTSAYVDVNGSGTIPTTGIYRPSTKTLGLSADGELIFKISNVSSPATSSIETGNFIVQSGNVGIGTASPLGKLHVYGLLRVGGAANEQTGIIALGNDANPVATYGDNGIFRGGIGTLGSGNYTNISSYQGIVFNVQNAAFGSQATRMIIDVNGNVGIGTTSPTGSLHVNNSVANIPILNLGGGVSVNNVSDLYVLNSYNTASGVGFAAKVIGVNISGSLTSGNIPVQRTVWSGVNSATAIVLSADDPGGGTNDNAFQIWTSNQGTSGSVLTQKFTLTADGNVGIGTTSPSDKLDVNGSTIITGSLNVSANITCLSLTETSTEAVKYNIIPLTSQLDNVLKLKPVSFNYKTNDKHSIGLIAEEVAKIYPEFTSENNDSISYGKITSVLIQSIKELKNIIDNQQKQIEDLSNKLKQF